MKCTNCDRAIYHQSWIDRHGEAHIGYVHLATNIDRCLVPGRIAYAKKAE